ncbi:hypothetical protein DIU31_016175 [Mucilaginibacter rubeus]|uniref:Uncharacterized protein n=1 Tax=Mucilaginibacter rubeus TaxID=2027860 RepID=A0AAE6JG77_9SPHI|nr:MULTISPECIES: hypothetical protein [Mucilaginibacter]QEM04975.1 hypothetical protein DIU31_016175 [Mucilaginibacter rubeus]QEM17569.1 hypothetical protein DIU38_016340 [Mucilaginibacter gossypii]QTE45910.1 hypothetical protein J3L19_11345 [Mucilaginibacter rubeus]QTE52507.1 hypothetical protein J3L21_11315 [Mucilaginibacter rubeus]QTE57596.1 hypothetical protein J3L23_02990 [Mucilaginibacter rubeus]
MEPEEELHSFQFCEEVAGVEHDYRITEMAAHVFGVEKDGVVIAEICNDSYWKQVSGATLDQALIGKIGDRIEDHYA